MKRVTYDNRIRHKASSLSVATRTEMLALPELKNNWRHTYVRRFREDAERSRLECLPRQLIFFIPDKVMLTISKRRLVHMKRRGKEEKWKVVKRRSLSMHKCLIRLHHRALVCVATTHLLLLRSRERLTPKDLSIFLMDLLSLPPLAPRTRRRFLQCTRRSRSLQLSRRNYSHANLTHFQQMSIEVFMRETSAWLGDGGLLRVSTLVSMLLLCCCRFTDFECVELNYFEWKWSSSDDKSYLTSWRDF